jgi:hypothetical protein
MLNEDLPFEQKANGLRIAVLRNAEIVQCFCQYADLSYLTDECLEQLKSMIECLSKKLEQIK